MFSPLPILKFLFSPSFFLSFFLLLTSPYPFHLSYIFLFLNSPMSIYFSTAFINVFFSCFLPPFAPNDHDHVSSFFVSFISPFSCLYECVRVRMLKRPHANHLSPPTQASHKHVCSDTLVILPSLFHIFRVVQGVSVWATHRFTSFPASPNYMNW